MQTRVPPWRRWCPPNDEYRRQTTGSVTRVLAVAGERLRQGRYTNVLLHEALRFQVSIRLIESALQRRYFSVPWGLCVESDSSPDILVAQTETISLGVPT